MHNKLRVLLLCLFVCFAFAFCLIHFAGYRFNFTSSMPIGIYRLDKNSDIKRGDIVEVCLPEKLANFAYQRGYIQKGSCNGFEPLVKKVIGLSGDLVKVENDAIVINGKVFLANIMKVDHNGKKLTATKISRINGYFLYGFGNKKESWDSRYFGAIQRKNIIGKMEKVIT